LKDKGAQRTGTLTATTLDALGNILTGRVVSWASGNVQIASVTQAGVVTAQDRGNTIVTATSEGKSGSANVVVQN
jgi:uncharacterized protein YjdB